MEGLGGMLKLASLNPQFRFHWRCKQNSITHLSFADDLMIFSHASIASMELIWGVLDTFSNMSSLVINHNKSLVFLSEVEEELARDSHNQLFELQARDFSSQVS
jgi:hypothetical protein